MNDFLPFAVPIIVGVIVLVSLGEWAVSGMWLPAYFRYGIPLFRQEIPLTTMPDMAAKIPELEQKLKRSAWRPSIVFRALNANEIAFRNNFGSRNSMSGLIRLEPSQGRMRISGHLYWTFLLTPFIFLMFMMILPISGFFLLFLLAIFVMTFGMQRYQYGKIAAAIMETATSTSSGQAVFTDSGQSVSAASKADNNPEPLWQESELTYEEPVETVQYDSEYQPFMSKKPQSGLNNTEMILIIALMSLVVIGIVVAILLFV